MRILITGGGGFLGRYILTALLARGDKVRILTRSQYPDLEKMGINCVRGDLRDIKTVTDACRDIDYVFHTAALAATWGRWKDFFAINVTGTRHVIHGCYYHKIKKLIYTSTPSVIFAMKDLKGVDETQPFPKRYYAHYPRSKAQAEQLVLASNGNNGLSTCALRPHLIWGPHDPHILPMIITRTKRNKLIQIGDGKNKISVSYVENVAHAHLQAADALESDSPLAGQAYFIADDTPVLMWSWINDLLSELNIPKVDRQLSYRNAYRLATFLEFTHRLCPFLGAPSLTRFLVANFAKSHYFTLDKARTDFAYQNIVAPSEAMQKTLSTMVKSRANRKSFL